MGLDMEQFDQSRHLKAKDLKGREIAVAISEVTSDEFDSRDGGKERLGVVFFKGGVKGLVLNKTNVRYLIDQFGQDSDDWLGKEVVLYSVSTQKPDGSPVQGVRVRVEQPVAALDAALEDEDIPF